MNRYTFEELEIGQKETFTAVISEQMVKSFGKICGDNNPLHIDDEFARSKGYGGRVVYGMLTASFLSTLAGVWLPGENSLIHQVETRFAKPVFIGDTLTVSGTISEKDERFSTIVLKVVIRNQHQEKVLRGSMKIGVL